jgi:hypothetical protein
MGPELHIGHEPDGCYQSGVLQAKQSGTYIKVSISKAWIGRLLQGQHIELLFLNDHCEQKGLLDIEMSDGKTEFYVSEELSQMIINM